MIRVAQLILVVAHLTCITSMVGADDWPQAAASPQRTAHVSDQPNPPYEVAWVQGWRREVLRNTCQPIIADGIVYVGTVSGNVHAVEAATGEDLWTARAGPPICHALACDSSRVIAAAMDGTIYAFDRRQGAPVWQADLSRRGFCAAPLLLAGRVFVGNRDGFCYAVAADTGELGWKTDTGDPIVQTAAGAGDRIVLVNEGMRAFCFNAGSGEIPGRPILCPDARSATIGR